MLESYRKHCDSSAFEELVYGQDRQVMPQDGDNYGALADMDDIVISGIGPSKEEEEMIWRNYQMQKGKHHLQTKAEEERSKPKKAHRRQRTLLDDS